MDGGSGAMSYLVIQDALYSGTIIEGFVEQRKLLYYTIPYFNSFVSPSVNIGFLVWLILDSASKHLSPDLVYNRNSRKTKLAAALYTHCLSLTSTGFTECLM